jgi:hypothetical protein
MARDSKLVFKFTREVAAAVGTGGLRVDILTGAAGTANAAFIYANAAGTAYNFNRAGSNGLNIGGFRTTLGDAANFGAQLDVSAVTGDPAIIGNTAQSEAYVRVVASLAGVAPTSGVNYTLQVEAASDSGTGTAGTDWIPVSAAVQMATKTTVRAVGVPATNTSLSGVITTAAAHGLLVGDIVVFSANTAGTVTLQKPYYVTSVPTSTTFGISNSLNGAVDTTVTGSTAMTLTATPVQKQLFSLPVAPSTRPWLRIAVVAYSTSSAVLAASQGVWIQDATYVVGRDMASIAS